MEHPYQYASNRLIPCAALATIGIIIAMINGSNILCVLGVAIFILFASAFLHIVTKLAFLQLTNHHLSVGRAAIIKFLLRIFGYAIILLVTLDLFGISIEKLLFGGAVIGIILGVAAQQALANFFASIVLIFSHPFSVGDDIVLFSGALGGKYTGKVMDLGLTHTRLKDEDGNIIYMPNATVLSGAAIMAQKKHQSKS